MSEETQPPDVVAFEGRCYRLDRIATTKADDVHVVRAKKLYTRPVLEHLGSVNKLTLSASGGNKVDGSMKTKVNP